MKEVSPTEPRGTILIVEDDPLFRRSLVTFVSALGFNALAEETGEAALQRCAAGGVDLCVTDYVLPSMSGIELAAAVRRRGLGVPLLLISGFLSESVESEAVQAGVRAILRKPADLAQLEAKILGILGRGAGA